MGKFRIRVLLSGSESDWPKNQDPIRKIRIQIHEKNAQKLQVQVEKNVISYLALSSLNTSLLGQAPLKPIQRT